MVSAGMIMLGQADHLRVCGHQLIKREYGSGSSRGEKHKRLVFYGMMTRLDTKLNDLETYTKNGFKDLQLQR